MIKRRSAGGGADGTQRSTGTFVEHATASFVESGDEQPSGGGTVRLRAQRERERESVDGGGAGGGARDERQQRSTLVLEEDATGTEPLPQSQPQRVPSAQQSPVAAATRPNAAPTQTSAQAASASKPTTTTATSPTSTDSPSPSHQPQFVTPKEIALSASAQNGQRVDGQGPAKPVRRPAGAAAGPHTPTNDPSDYALMQRSLLEGNFDFVCLFRNTL